MKLTLTTDVMRGLLPAPRGMEDRPSILEQTQWETGFFAFQGDDVFGIEYFNPSIVDWKGARWLVTRRRMFTHSDPGKNDIVFWMLNGVATSNPKPVKVRLQYSGENHEDPRAINRNGHVILSYCNFRHYSKAHICIGAMNDAFQINNPMHLVYDGNGSHLMGNTRNQKNWLPFIHDSKLHVVYNTWPEHEILRAENGQVVKVHISDSRPWSWNWGEPRGGTPPVLIGKEYWTFFHSSLLWRYENERKRNRYYMGAIAFSAEPPFTITRMTRKPLLAGSERDPRNMGAPLVVFPCGATFDGNEWFVVFGVNDCKSAWIKIPHHELCRML